MMANLQQKTVPKDENEQKIEQATSCMFLRGEVPNMFIRRMTRFLNAVERITILTQ